MAVKKKIKTIGNVGYAIRHNFQSPTTLLFIDGFYHILHDLSITKFYHFCYMICITLW